MKKYFLFNIMFFIAIAIIFIGCEGKTLEGFEVDNEIVKIVVNQEIINSSDVFKIIEPLWWSVSIYDGEKQYVNDLKKFTLAQKYVFAIEWYIAEVNNGGHNQFYYNSTGIVWEDAMKGFEVIGLKENYEILKESAQKLGGFPSKDREKRQQQLDKYEADFDDLDERLYKSEYEIENALLKYIRANSDDFFLKD